MRVAPMSHEAGGNEVAIAFKCRPEPDTLNKSNEIVKKRSLGLRLAAVFPSF
jgi:hypothetical protein